MGIVDQLTMDEKWKNTLNENEREIHRLKQKVTALEMKCETAESDSMTMRSVIKAKRTDRSGQCQSTRFRKEDHDTRRREECSPRTVDGVRTAISRATASSNEFEGRERRFNGSNICTQHRTPAKNQ